MERFAQKDIDQALLSMIDSGEVEVIYREGRETIYKRRACPWTYTQLLTWIGLEGLYQTYLGSCAKAKQPPYFRSEWLKLPALIAVTPDAVVAILQAGLMLNTSQSFLLGPGPQVPNTH